MVFLAGATGSARTSGLAQPGGGAMAVTDEPAREAAHADPAPPSKEYGWVVFITSVLGLWASAALAVDYIRRLADDAYVASCDITPLIGCGLFLDSPAASTFAIPNVIVGVAEFPVMATLALLLRAGARFPVWVWRGTPVGTLLGVGFVTYLQYQAMFVLHGLCPWCLVIWVGMIPLFVHPAARAGEAGALGKGSRPRRGGNRRAS